jgi:hypothetical protein
MAGSVEVKRGHDKFKRATEDERSPAARTDSTFQPMRRKETKVALDSKMKRAMDDERFKAARTDPRFRPMQRKELKVALDSRFTPILTDPMFDYSEAPVDKRGRCRKKSAMKNPMLRYYLNQQEGDEKDKEKTEQEKLIREEEDHELEEEDELDEEESSSSDKEDDNDQVMFRFQISDLHSVNKKSNFTCMLNQCLFFSLLCMFMLALVLVLFFPCRAQNLTERCLLGTNICMFL